VSDRKIAGRNLDHRGETRSCESPLAQSLVWRRAGKGWQLFAGKRRFGKVIPDSKHPGMWRTPLLNGRVSDMANLSWARNAVMEAAVREIEFEAKQEANTPSNSQQIGAVFQAPAAHSDLTAPDGPRPSKGGAL
jgi:hypothetical protein